MNVNKDIDGPVHGLLMERSVIDGVSNADENGDVDC